MCLNAAFRSSALACRRAVKADSPKASASKRLDGFVLVWVRDEADEEEEDDDDDDDVNETS